MNDYNQGIKLMLIQLAEAYSTEMTENRLKVYTLGLADSLVGSDLQAVIKKLITDPKIKKLPLVHEILEAANPKVSEKTAAIELVDKIKKAVSKFGHTNAAGAKEYIGPIGWELVERNGRWYSLTRSTTAFKGIEYAQLRDSAESLITQYNKGILHERNPELAETVKAPRLELRNKGAQIGSTQKLNDLIKNTVKEIQ